MKRPSAGGGFPALWYTLKKARESGGLIRMYRALSSRNACKTCALGMGGQAGGMINEAGHFPEVCKKSIQAMAADMQGRIRAGFFEEFTFDKLSRMTPRELEHAGRIVEPMYAAPGDAGYRAISWDQAIDIVGETLKRTRPDRSFFYFSGRSSNEAGFLLQLAARVYGTNNVNNCSFFCHQASGVGLATTTGSGTATVSLEDVESCDLLFVIGGNPASNHPRFMRTIMDHKRRGGRVIVVNPVRELGLTRFKVPSDPLSLLLGTKIADIYLQPHIGGDIALLVGIAKVMLERNAADMDFIAACTEGYHGWRDVVEVASWDELERRSGVPRREMEAAANAYLESNRTVFAWTMGITHHEHGVENVQAIANLAMMRGMVGKPGAGLLPLRGHSNVQGIGSMGAVPKLRGSVAAALESKLGVKFPAEMGLDTLGCIEHADRGVMDLAVHLGGNLFGSCPDAGFAERALSKIGLTVFLSTTLNTGHARGRGQRSLILPVLARDEEPQATTQESMFNFVRMSDGGPLRYVGPRSEVSIIADIAASGLSNSGVYFSRFHDHAVIREMIAEVIPGYHRMGEMNQTKREFEIQGRVFHRPTFNTPSGRARFHAVRIPELRGAGDELRLMTIRSEGQFNTVVYEEHDIYRGQERRDVIMMNPADIARLGLKVDDEVTVTSSAGEMQGILIRELDIRQGNAAMYYPEVNVLVPRSVDGSSRTPAFKNVVVRVSKRVRLGVIR